jgi:predicted enzyme related to lactoylglutathione lyase
MPDAKTFVVNAPAWVDLSSKDAEGSRNFYAKLFGWKVEVTTDPNAATRSPNSEARTSPGSARRRIPTPHRRG